MKATTSTGVALKCARTGLSRQLYLFTGIEYTCLYKMPCRNKTYLPTQRSTRIQVTNFIFFLSFLLETGPYKVGSNDRLSVYRVLTWSFLTRNWI